MRKNLFLMVSVFTLLLVGCEPSRDIACQINASQSFNWNGHKITHSLYIEKEYERFTWTWDGPSNKTNYFYFTFSYNDIYLDNSDEFKYIASNNEEVLFELIDDTTKEKYEFVGPITIYIDYANSSSEIKDIINGDNYNISIAGDNWFAVPSIFE